jgi:hypothetical protein
MTCKLTLRHGLPRMSQIDIGLSQSYVAIGAILPRWMLLQIALRDASMAHSHLTTHLAQRGDMLLSGQIDTLLATYAFPLPVFLEQRLLLVRSHDQARAILDHVRASLADRGVALIQPKVTAVELPRAGRYRVWVDWYEGRVPSDASLLMQAIYYCRDTADGSRIEMVNCTRLPHPGLDRQIEALALTA